MNDIVKWVQVTPDQALIYCKKLGFKEETVDLFNMDETVYSMPNTKLSFKYREQLSDPVKFYILPMIDKKVVSLEEFNNELYKDK